MTWPKEGLIQDQPHDRFEARVFEVDGDGGPAGGEVAVFEAWRTDVDPEEDVPVFGPENDSNTAGRSSSFKRRGPVFSRAEGELWREEWIEPRDSSERVRGDDPLEPVFYVIDAAGTRESGLKLNDQDIGRYLWFDARVIPVLANRRGGGLRWYTADTGSVWCSPDDAVHFGVNGLGLINVYAYDVARLAQWQQRIWASHNVAPDGAVSAELLDAQMRTRPARTRAPEADLRSAMNELDATFKSSLGAPLFIVHEASEEIFRSAHRFRAADKDGIFALAKDVARLTADRIDVGVLQKIVVPPKGEKWGSLKSLEKLLATRLPPDEARAMVAPLVGIYELRLRDAHLPSSEINEAFALANVDPAARPLEQGRQLLESAVSALRAIFEALAPSDQAT
jgi:hypothetical protein